jgi:subtilisin family serine protease
MAANRTQRQRRMLWIYVLAVVVVGCALFVGLPAHPADSAVAWGGGSTSSEAAFGDYASRTQMAGGLRPSLSPWLMGSEANLSRTGDLSADYRAGEVIVRFEPGMSFTAMVSANRDAGASTATKLGTTVPGLYKIRLQKGVSVEAAVAAYSGQPGVLYAQPNHVFKVATTPDDPDFGELWGLNNTGQDDGVVDADIDAPEAWATATGSTDVVVAVIDTGVDYTHADLAANMWKNPGEVPDNNLDDDGNGYVDDVYGIDTAYDDSDPMDDYGHGTHCSGTIGAVGDNGVGVVGVNWHVRIMAVKFLDSGGSGSTEDAIEAIEYAAAMGADVFSNSWGGGPYDQALYDTIAGIDKLFCFAAGNWSENTDYFVNYPSGFDLPNIVSVGASTRNEEAADFSNYGQLTVDLFAPGDEILSTVPGGYEVHGGTSMATPHVAGAAALLLSEYPGMTWQRIKTTLMGAGDPKAAYADVCLSGKRLNLLNALSAGADGTTGLTGTVTCEGEPVAGADVAFDSTISVETLADGFFAFAEVPLGLHSLVVSAEGCLTKVVTDIALHTGSSPYVEVELHPAGLISGTVLATSGGALLEGITATAYRVLDEQWLPAGSGTTAADGTYTIGGLASGDYFVEFGDESLTYASQYYDGVTSMDEATSVPVVEGETTLGVDASLLEFGHIRGRVTAAAGGAPIPGVFVTAYREDYGWWYPEAGTEVLEDGTYDLTGLYGGTYRLEFFDPGGEYAYEFYNDADRLARGRSVDVDLGGIVSGIDASLAPAATISGTILADAGAAPLDEAYAIVYRRNGTYWEPFVGTVTDADGAYEVGGLRGGTYRVEFAEPSGLYADQFYKDKPTLGMATAVAVGDRAARTGIDARLHLAGSISGTVTDVGTAEPLAGIWVTVYGKTSLGWEARDWCETGVDGTYASTNLAPGEYRLEFVDFNSIYVGQFYRGKSTVKAATSVVVAAGATTEGVDAPLARGGVISGTVTRAFDGSPVPWAWVNVYVRSGSSLRWVSGATADEDGSYSVGGLSTGSYIVEFYDAEGVCAFEFYNSKLSAAKANPVAVTVGATRSGIDATLDKAATISGKVTNSNGVPLQGIAVLAYRTMSSGVWEPISWTETGERGTYSLGGLCTGAYKVEFFDPMGRFVSEYYPDNTTQAHGKVVNATSGLAKTGIDVSLKLAGPGELRELPASVLSPTMRAWLSRR